MALTLGLPLAGCFDQHMRGDPDAGVLVRDAGDPPPRDAGDPPPPPMDAGPPPGLCMVGGSARITRACAPFSSVPAGIPSELPIALDGECFCGETLACSAEVVGPRRLALRTELCSDGPLCDACFPSVEGSCSLPPLEAGNWDVEVNGSLGMVLYVHDEPLPPVESCTTTAPVVLEEGPEYVCDWPGTAGPRGAFELCHDLRVPSGRSFLFELAETCAGCFDQAGLCQVNVEGNTIHLWPSPRSCECHVCGACAEICHRLDMECRSPPLAPGVYRVAVGDRFVTELFVDDEGGPTDRICTTSSGTAP